MTQMKMKINLKIIISYYYQINYEVKNRILVVILKAVLTKWRLMRMGNDEMKI